MLLAVDTGNKDLLGHYLGEITAEKKTQGNTVEHSGTQWNAVERSGTQRTMTELTACVQQTQDPRLHGVICEIVFTYCLQARCCPETAQPVTCIIE